MSLFIDSRKIVGVYALGQWFNVKPDTFAHDSFELICWEEEVPFGNESNNPSRPSDHPREPHSVAFQMGAIYKGAGIEPPASQGYIGNSRMAFANPSGSTGVTFVDADTGLTTSMSLLEIKAFRECSTEDAIEACPHLKPANEHI